MILKKIMVLLSNTMIINHNTMNNDTTKYKVMSTRECITYLEKCGLTIHDDSTYRIKSTSGLVYILPDGEVVLIPTNFDLDYPGIIFKNLETFQYYAALDFFPIGDDEMTWFERYYDKIKLFREQPEFYSETITESLHVRYPFIDTEDIKAAFQEIQSILGSKRLRDLSFAQVHLICSFGLSVINYLIDFKGFKLIFRDTYENYNRTTNVLVEKDGKIRNVISECLIFLDGYHPDNFRLFRLDFI